MKIIKLCEFCGNEFETIDKRKRFCNNSCSMKYKRANYKYKQMEYTTEIRKKLSDSMKKNWQNEDFRNNNHKRMTENNPMFNQENITKMMNSLAINGTKNTKNNFKYGNGKISLAEQTAFNILKDKMFLYNYAIGMKELRITYPEMRFARNYKPDFVNLKYKIAIEIDGDNHNSPKSRESDKKKIFALNYYGYKVFRFTNNYIINETEKFKKDIEEILRKCMES